MAAGEEKQLWRLTNGRIKAKLLCTAALVPRGRPRLKTDNTEQQQQWSGSHRRKKKKINSFTNPLGFCIIIQAAHHIYHGTLVYYLRL